MSSPRSRGGDLLPLVTAAAAAYGCAMEWLFFVTKPSFLSTASTGEALGVLFRSCLVVALPLALGAALLGLGGRLGTRLARLLPTLALAATLLLMLDNFTYIVLGLGVKTATGAWKLAYAPVLLGLSVLAHRLVLSLEEALAPERPRRMLRGACLVGLALSLLACTRVEDPAREVRTGGGRGGVGSASGRRPNILLLASDGLAARRMQLYGAPRETTPFLSRFLAERAGNTLLCENALVNGSNTGASVTSLLTGKHPTRVRVYHAPDILHGGDSYQHLPGLLRGLGYRNLSVSIRHYADAYDFNMLHAFDESNDQRLPEFDLGGVLGRWVGREAVYLLTMSYERVRNRLQYLLGRRESVDSFFQATGERPFNVDDLERIAQFERFVDRTPGPFFAHLHLTGTHGPRFGPRRRVFSRGQVQDREWMADLYDDSILDFDAMVEQLVESLASRGRLEDTLIVLHSDHGPRVEYSLGYSSTERVPLAFVLPRGEGFPEVPGRRIRANAQNLDIAPTLLDFLGLEPPPWMDGASLLHRDPDPRRPIFSAESVETVHGELGWVVDPSRAGPPFRSLGAVGVVLGAQRFCLDLRARELLVGAVAGHSAPGIGEPLPGPREAVGLLRGHLLEAGYPVDSLEGIRPYPAPPRAPGVP